MSDEKKTKIVNSLIPRPGFVFLQLVMFFLVYGLDMKMPWWAMWFPSLIMGGIIAVILGILLVGLIVIMVDK